MITITIRAAYWTDDVVIEFTPTGGGSHNTKIRTPKMGEMSMRCNTVGEAVENAMALVGGIRK